MKTLVYLRKSREDREAEKRGEGETLARHESALIDTANRLNLVIDSIYKEVVSGESISDRPMMQKLLKEVEQGLWHNVLVMEVERLARGDSIDQGIISRAFTYSGTKIVTPLKVYDPRNEYDSEYFEFSLFMSRREYKTINRRMQQGRTASVKEGKYPGNKTPFGYERIKIPDDKGYTLKPVAEEASVIQLIFEWFVYGLNDNGAVKRLGSSLIANRLNTMGIKPIKAELWSYSTIAGILKNPVYIGKIRWNSRKETKTIKNGEVITKRPRNTNPLITEGLHPAIISEELFLKAQGLFTKSNTRISKHTTSLFSGLIICGHCGHKMKKRRHGKRLPYDLLICGYPGCPCVSSSLEIIENRISAALSQWLEGYTLNIKKQDTAKALVFKQHQTSLSIYRKELGNTEGQLRKIYELLEKGLYHETLFLSRSAIINEKIIRLNLSISAEEHRLKELCTNSEEDNNLPDKVKLMEVYQLLDKSEDKNLFLKEIIEKIEYTKSEGGRWLNSTDKFRLTIYPKIPKSAISLTSPFDIQKN